MRKKNLKKLPLLLLILFLSIISTQCTSKDKEIEQALSSLVETVNRQCPITVDEIMYLDRCEAKGKELTNFYVVTDTSNFDVKQFEEIGVPSIKEMLKSNPQIDVYRKYEVVIKYRYQDESGKEFYSITLNPSDY